MTTSTDLAEATRRYVDDPDAERVVVKYYSGSYTGALFDSAPELQSDDRNRFTAHDFAAVATLSVELNGRSIKQLIERGDRLSELLAKVPDIDLVDASDEDLEAIYRIQDALDDIQGVGHVRRSKLLAHKRPRLVPIRDQHVLVALTGTDHGYFTQPLRDVLRADEALVDRLDELALKAPVPISRLRALDVVVWMMTHGDAQVAD